MGNQAKVLFFRNEFVAELPDGERIAQPDLKAMAQALFRAGVGAEEIQYEWRPGSCMITAGQQVALRAEIKRLKRVPVALTIAA